MNDWPAYVIRIVLVAWITVAWVQLRMRPPKRRAKRKRGTFWTYYVADARGRLGYIGKTNNLARRLAEHGFDVDHVRVVPHPDEASALAVEQRAIKAAAGENPLENVVYNHRKTG